MQCCDLLLEGARLRRHSHPPLAYQGFNKQALIGFAPISQHLPTPINSPASPFIDTDRSVDFTQLFRVHYSLQDAFLN